MVLVVELVNLMSLHITRIYRLAGRIKHHWHLEKEHIIRSWWCACHLITHAVEVVAIAEKFAGEAAKNEDVLAIFLNGTASLALREHLVVDCDFSPFVLV